MGGAVAGQCVLTYQARPWSAIDAIIGAGRGSRPDDPTRDRNAACLDRARKVFGRLDGPAAMLLARLLDVVSASTKPCIQFVACGNVVGASTVAMAASQAAASILGRSLLIDARLDCAADENIEAPQSVSLPDAFVQGLYHHRLTHCTSDISLLLGPNRQRLLATLIAPFQFIAIDARAPCEGPVGTALAAMCSATVLIVRAGESSHGAIKDAARHITRAGGKVIGSVLEDAPPNLPGWIARV